MALFADSVSNGVCAFLAGRWSQGLIKELGTVDGRAQTVVMDAVSFAINVSLLSIKAFNTGLERQKSKACAVIQENKRKQDLSCSFLFSFRAQFHHVYRFALDVSRVTSRDQLKCFDVLTRNSIHVVRSRVQGKVTMVKMATG